MSPEEPISTARQSLRPRGSTSSRRTVISLSRPAGLIRFVFLIAAVAELLSMLLMTVYRYRAQGLEPTFLDISKTGNLLGLLLAASYVVLFTTLALVERGRRVGIASAAVTFATAGLALLSLGPLVAADDRIYVFSGYLLFKTIEWAYFMAVL